MLKVMLIVRYQLIASVNLNNVISFSNNEMQFCTCRSIIQLLVMISKLRVVKLLHSEKTAAACSIGAWQIRLASASVIPDGVGHAKFGCNGPDGKVMMGGWTVSLAVMMMLRTTLQCSIMAVTDNKIANIIIFIHQ